MMVNEVVEIHSGYKSVGGQFIYEKFIEGKVVKVNKKSIRVHLRGLSLDCRYRG